MGLSKTKSPATSLQTLQMAEEQRMRDDTGRAAGPCGFNLYGS